MKVFFDHFDPFFLAHGGLQIQIEQTFQALQRRGVQVQYLKWWETGEMPDVIHFFGRVPVHYVHFAHQKGIKVVMSELLTGLAARSSWQRHAQKALMRVTETLLPPDFTVRLGWRSFREVDACVALTPWERELFIRMFGAPSEKVEVIPNGVEDFFFQKDKAPAARGRWLICTATITERKRVLELAQAAGQAGVPLWIIGKPYSLEDPYYQAFQGVMKRFPHLRFEGAIEDRRKLAEVYKEARGFVLWSAMESLSLSALEAAAAGCPLLLSDLPWAQSVFGSQAHYLSLRLSNEEAGRMLKSFYDEAPQIPRSMVALSWDDVAARLETLYRDLSGIKTEK